MTPKSPKGDNLGPLEFKALDFSRAEMQRAFGENADWFYQRLADIANRLLVERLSKAPEVYGCEKDAITKHMRWSESQWVNIHTSEVRTSHRARLICIEKLEGKP